MNLLTLDTASHERQSLIDGQLYTAHLPRFDRQIERQIDRKIERQIERQIERPTSIVRQTCADRQTDMIVKTRSKGREIVGLYVGANNARRYFPREVTAIDLHLDHLRISCHLPPEFWDEEAEIRDPRLCAWLQLKNFYGKAGDDPAQFTMIPCGKNSFRLQPVTMRAHARSRRTAEHSHRNVPVTAA